MADEPQLKSRIWAEALIRRARLGGAFAYLRHHGDDDAGTVILKIARMDGRAVLWTPIRDEYYRRVWVPRTTSPQSEAEIDAALEKDLQRDPDLWVIEIEDREGRHFLLHDEFMDLDP